MIKTNASTKAPLEKLRSRWKRWLGQKTRVDKPYWTTLLDSNWLGWPNRTLYKHGIDIIGPTLHSSIQEIKSYYLQAIECADFQDLARLDNLYATDLIERGIW